MEGFKKIGILSDGLLSIWYNQNGYRISEIVSKISGEYELMVWEINENDLWDYIRGNKTLLKCYQNSNQVLLYSMENYRSELVYIETLNEIERKRFEPYKNSHISKNDMKNIKKIKNFILLESYV